MIVLDAPLTSLRANSSDRFPGQPKPFRYPGTDKPITRLRLVGQQGGRWYYAAIDDTAAMMPVPAIVSVAIGGKLGGRRL